MEKTVSINWYLLGAQLATLSDQEQAYFFRGFLKELDTFDTNMHKEMQMFRIAERMLEKEKDIAERFLSCLWFKK